MSIFGDSLAQSHSVNTFSRFSADIQLTRIQV